ncbi:glycosyltransferase [Nocardiopsis dassonvillei]|uniref:glycosyltransferase n=1 Tax=Nocardiopsis dassonvillei TaxID=2014 RepID=UPI00364365BF
MRHGANTRRRTGTVAAGVITALAAIGWAAVYRTYWGQQDVDGTLVIYLVIAAVLIFSLGASAAPRTFHHLPAARGRVVCIIPSFNENQTALDETLWSILGGTIVPDQIHVVDDGSATPVVPWQHPRIVWHRQANAGKRHAQALVLEQLRAARAAGEHPADFILTIDSDCTVDRFAVQHLLRAMSDQRVQAATGLPILRNRTTNWITRITDLEMVAACLTLRAARSRLGVVAPCSGALSLYRADLVLDNLDDYVTSGTAGDDRRLTHYALLRGHAVAVDDAVVATEMPDTLRAVYRQRVRWFKSYWRYAPWEIAHLPSLPVWWRTYALVMSVVVPIALIWVFAIAPVTGHGVQWQGLAYWAGLSWISTAKYGTSRPDAPALSRWITWAIGTPLLMLLQVFLLRPAQAVALLQARTEHWNNTRGTAAALPAPEPLLALPAATPDSGPDSAELWLADLHEDARPQPGRHRAAAPAAAAEPPPTFNTDPHVLGQVLEGLRRL